MWLDFVNWLIYNLLGFSPTSSFASAIHFFIYDTIKIIFLLAVIIFIIAVIRTFLPPEKTKKMLEKMPLFFGNIAASFIGIITPFCSCSAVPLFIGFIEAGVPLGATFSFLVSSPMINEIALVLLWGLFGWKIALIYILSGLIIAIISGIIIGKLKMEKHIEDYVYQMKVGVSKILWLSWKQRLLYARGYTIEILKKVWVYILIGIGVGSVMHGYAPQDLLSKIAGPGNPFAVLIVVLIGIPLYANAAGIIPIVNVLIQKGMAIGTALSFMMSVTALSLPEGIILRKVLKPKLLFTFFGIVGFGIIITGFLFNWLLF